MEYSIKKLATIAGVSVRTLHYYDAINLLKPSYKNESGYRIYTEKEVLKLQQILFFRNLDFSLERIEKILDDPLFSQVEALNDHKKLLKLEKARIDRLLKTIDKTILLLNGGEKMNTNDLFVSFIDPKQDFYKEEVKEKWGNTNAYKQSQVRTKNWTQADFEKIKEESNAISLALASLSHLPVDNTDVQAIIKRQFHMINKFYDCSLSMFQKLGEMYVADERFAEHYNKVQSNLAEYMRDAINFYCNVK